MSVKLIYACSLNNVIGKDDKLPWNIPEDLKRFARLTKGSYVIMGRKTWESLPNQKLPGREPVVITSKSIAGVLCLRNLDDFFEGYARSTDNIFLNGGNRILQDGAKYADNIELTKVYNKITGDNIVMGPTFDFRDWIQDSVSEIKNYNGVHYQFCSFRRARNDTNNLSSVR